MEQNRELRNKSYTYGQLIYDKGGKKIYNGETTVSLISHVGKTGHLHLKE